MKKMLLIFALFAGVCSAQTNVQIYYDFGSQYRSQQVTTTIEHNSFDNFGSNFFFVDFDFGLQGNSPFAVYTEYARSLNFWKNTKAKDLSLHIEYNGGCAIGYGMQHTGLIGLEYMLNSADYRYFITFVALARYTQGVRVPVQGTIVWGCEFFKGLAFSGFADLYENSGFAVLSELQLWYNIGTLFGLDNLHVGAEIELSYNFAGRGFMCNPCLGIKWKL